MEAIIGLQFIIIVALSFLLFDITLQRDLYSRMFFDMSERYEEAQEKINTLANKCVDILHEAKTWKSLTPYKTSKIRHNLHNKLGKQQAQAVEYWTQENQEELLEIYNEKAP